jgi:hypothetical protein
MTGNGDRLASGAKSATFSVGGSHKSDLQWDIAILTEQEFLAKYVGTSRTRYLELLAEYEQGKA